MSHNDDKERSILARIRQRKKNEKSERSQKVRIIKREWFFFKGRLGKKNVEFKPQK